MATITNQIHWILIVDNHYHLGFWDAPSDQESEG